MCGNLSRKMICRAEVDSEQKALKIFLHSSDLEEIKKRQSNERLSGVLIDEDKDMFWFPRKGHLYTDCLMASKNVLEHLANYCVFFTKYVACPYITYSVVRYWAS